MMKTIKRTFLILIVVLLAVAGSGSIVVTQENEYKLIRQFGRVERVIGQAGLSFKIPFSFKIHSAAPAVWMGKGRCWPQTLPFSVVQWEGRNRSSSLCL